MWASGGLQAARYSINMLLMSLQHQEIPWHQMAPQQLIPHMRCNTHLASLPLFPYLTYIRLKGLVKKDQPGSHYQLYTSYPKHSLHSPEQTPNLYGRRAHHIPPEDEQNLWPCNTQESRMHYVILHPFWKSQPFSIKEEVARDLIAPAHRHPQEKTLQPPHHHMF